VSFSASPPSLPPSLSFFLFFFLLPLYSHIYIYYIYDVYSLLMPTPMIYPAQFSIFSDTENGTKKQAWLYMHIYINMYVTYIPTFVVKSTCFMD
jgi:hypothetical protein